METIVKVGDESYSTTSEEAKQLRELLQFSPAEVKSRLAAALTPAGTRPPMIYAAMIRAMRAVSHVAKDGYNQQQNYPFRGIDGVVNALGPALREAGVFVLPELVKVDYRDARTTQDKPTREVITQVRYTFVAEDGSSVPVLVPGESLDTSDKGTAKAMSVALRIALLQVFQLPTQEPTTDHDGHYHQRGGEPRMSGFERAAGLAQLAPPTTDQRATLDRATLAAAFDTALAFRACLDEHSSWQTPTNGAESPTWEELFVGRIADEIANADTEADVKRLWDRLAAAKLDLEHQGKRFSQLLKERLAAIRQRDTETFDDLTKRILAASDRQELNAASLAVDEANALDHIASARLGELHQLILDRNVRILRQETQAHTDADHRGQPESHYANTGDERTRCGIDLTSVPFLVDTPVSATCPTCKEGPA